MKCNLLWLCLLMAILCGCAKQTGSNDSAAHEDEQDRAKIISIDRRVASRSRDKSSADSRPTSRTTSAPAAATSAPAVIVSGLISLPDGRPAAGGDVSLYTYNRDDKSTMPWKMSSHVVAGSKGEYTVMGPRADGHAITATALGFSVATRGVEGPDKSSSAGPLRQIADIRLEPEAKVSGRIVTDAGNPVMGAHVLAGPTNLAPVAVSALNTYTGPDGRFTLRGLPEGGYTAAVITPEIPVQFFELGAPDDQVSISLSQKIPVVDARLVSDDISLEGKTTSVTISTNSKMQGLRLATTVIADGSKPFSFGKLPSLDHEITLSTHGPDTFFPAEGSIRSGVPYQSLNLDDGISTTVEIKVSGGKTIRGIVVDEDTSAPLPGVKLYRDSLAMKENRDFVETTATGEFRLPHVMYAKTVRVAAEGYHAVAAANSLMLNLDLELSNTLVMARSSFIRGTVLAESGVPVPGATLKYVPPGASKSEPVSAPISVSGNFEFAAHAGQYRLRAEAPGYAPAMDDALLVEEEDINNVSLVLGKGRSVRGTVTTHDGHAAAGAVVSVYETGDGMMNRSYSPGSGGRLGTFYCSVRADNQGQFAVKMLPVKIELTVAAEYPGSAHPGLYALAAGTDDVENVKLVLPASATLRGTVSDEEGKAIGGAAVRFSSASDLIYYSNNTVTTTSGSFVLASLPAESTSSLYISKKGYKSDNRQIMVTDVPLSVTLTANETRPLLIKCLDISSHKPVDATLTVRSTSTPDTKIQADKVPELPGVFSIAEATVGHTYLVTAKADGYMAKEDVFQLDKDLEREMLMRTGGKATGRVIDKERKPVAGAKVLDSRNSEKPNAVTKIDGRFEINLESSSQKYFAVSEKGEVSDTFVPRLSSGGTVDVGDVMVMPQQDIVVRVLRGTEPAKDVKVKIQSYNGMKSNINVSGKTDRSGEFRTAAQYNQQLSVSLPDNNLTVWDEGNTDKGDRERVITMHMGGATLHGRLMLRGEPVAGNIYGVLDTASGDAVSKDIGSDGEFKFKDMAPGEWRLQGSSMMNGYVFNSITVRIPDSDEVIEKDLVLSEEKIAGRVVTEAGLSVAGATVYAESDDGASEQTTTDETGQFQIRPQIKKTITFQASKDGSGRSDKVTVSIPETGEITPITLVLKTGSGKIVCTALSLLDGLPLSRASAKLIASDGRGEIATAYSSSGEEAVLSQVQPGEYQVVLSAYGYSEATRSVTVEEEQTVEVTEVLSPASSVAVQVTDANGYSSAGVPVTLTPLDGDSLEPVRSAVSNQNGIAKFPGVLFGSYQVEGASPTGAAGSVTVSTRNQVAVTARLVLLQK